MSTRRDRFREQIRRLEATGAADKAFAEGWVRARPSPGLVEQIAAPLDLRDGVSLALIGGIGSGKTTELLRARELLRQTEGQIVAYVDVGQRASLASLKAQALIGVVGHALAVELKAAQTKGLADYASRFQRLTFGYDRPRYERDDDEEIDDWEQVPGLVRAPSRHGPLGDLLAEMTARAREAKLRLIALVDGLDRIVDMPTWLALRDDIETIKRTGIGALYVAPVSFRLNPAHRDLAAMFDQDISFPYLDVDKDSTARRFLMDVLRARSLDEMLPDDVCERLVALSGGALRDLLQLAQLATQISYGAGDPRVTPAAVEQAGDRIGRKMLLGISEEQLRALQALRTSKSFALTTDATVALAVGGLVLFYDGPRFGVHPCVLPILASLPREGVRLETF